MRLPSVSRIKTDRLKTAFELESDIAQQTALCRNAAQLARQFHIQNPGHPKANEARKLEAIFAIRGVVYRDTTQENAAIALAKSFRDNLTFAAADRAEVALAMDRLSLSIKARNGEVKRQASEWEKLADSLRVEFGLQPVLQSYYLQLARDATSENAARIAAKVSEATELPPAAKREAQSIIERTSLLGTVIGLKLPRFGGGDVDLAERQEKVTAVVIFPVSKPESLVELKRLKAAPKGSQIVFLALGGNTSEAAAAYERLPIPGTMCHAAEGRAALSVVEKLRVGRAPVPFAYIFDRDGKLSAFSRIPDLASLVIKATKSNTAASANSSL
jgi:hypothetical protein